jgi:nitroreductase
MRSKALAPQIDLASVDHVLTTTRAVRRRLDLGRPVSAAVIRECIEIATYAPNARNEQDWRWVIVTEPERRAQVAELMRRPGGEAGRTTGRPVDPRIMSANVHLNERLERVPAFVFACILTRLRPDANDRVRADFYGSIIPAVWSFQLALRARGLGSVFTTGFLRHEVAFMDLLRIPGDVTPVVLIPVAYFKGDLSRPPRVPVDDVIFWERWGQRRDRAP